MRLVMKNTYKFGIDLHVLYIDFQQAYDVIGRKHLYKILKEFRIPKKGLEVKEEENAIR
jgi:hypothetical protein